VLMSIAKRALALPIVFDTYQSLVGAEACHQRFVREYVTPCEDEAILDIGCGTGACFASLPRPIKYTGVDISESYIKRARAQYGHEGTFLVADASAAIPQITGRFDRVFAFGVLHHLSDDQVVSLINNLVAWVRPGGSFTSLDPCYTTPQNALARFLISHDRGQSVRTPEVLQKLFGEKFVVNTEIVTDMLRVPYTLVILRMTPSDKASTAAA
jgi:cyclopropane fatty-acyl-phospholipid synthase-like methyltransferase